jgi:hypothetical protein
MGTRNGFVVLVLAVAAAGNADAQSVVSVRSGLLNYSEGAVFINNQPVKQQAGAYPALQEGSDLLTQSGRVEMLLTPSAYLRIGQNSAVRMISSRLTDTKIELLYGSAMLDSSDALDSCAITLIYKNRQVKITKPGKYRIDSEPPQFRVFQGKAEIQGAGAPVTLLADQIAPLDGETIVKRFTEGSDDLLDIWSDERHFLIASSLSNAQDITDPATTDDSSPVAGDLGAYLGYVPPATIAPAPIAPLVGIYNPYPAGMIGLGYGSYYPMGIYPAYLYTGIYYPAPLVLRRSIGGIGSWNTVPLHTFTPARPISPYYPGGTVGTVTRTPGVGIGVSRPVGGVGVSRPVGGVGISRPVGGAGIGARPVAPHVGVHR